MEKLKYGVYRLIRGCFQLFYPKTELAGIENLPEKPCIIVSNHCKLNGPAAATLCFPEHHVPYPNVPKRNDVYNLPEEDATHEETRC